MSIFVTMAVGPVDWSKFQAAMKASEGTPATGRSESHVYRAEGDPQRVLITEVWDSHDAMHAYQDKVGEEFNRLAGTEGMDWDVTVWEEAS